MAKTQTFQAFRFTVVGRGQFPVDMLRYDRCVPETQDDIASAFSPFSGDHRQINLIAFTPKDHKPEPTSGRWTSFGWEVILKSVKSVLA